MNIILLGPPGAGKGTQANNLVKDCKLYKISTGDLLREEIRNSTVLGNKIKSIIDKGLLVTDDIINDLIKKALSNKKINNRLIFDGYPRNLDQAKELDLLVKKNNQKISCALSLEVDKESIIKRILGRQICSKCGLIFNEYFSPATVENHNCDIKFLYKRSDDNEIAFNKRLKIYKDQTLPILNHYEKKKILHKINAEDQISNIYKQIYDILMNIKD